MSDLPQPRRLTKRQVETLLETYDSDPVASLTEALAALMGDTSAAWDEIVETLPVPPDIRQRLGDMETDAMDALVKQLVEFRSLEQ